MRSFLLACLAVAGVAQAALAQEACRGDFNGDTQVTIEEVIQTVNGALSGCVACARSTVTATGQTTCYTTQFPTTCVGDVAGQDGAIKAGAPLRYVDNGDGTITDSNTGLMWEKLSDDNSIHRHSSRRGWGAAFGKIDTLNETAFAGYSDWRLPNIKELQSIVDFGRDNPAMDPVFNVRCVEGCDGIACSCPNRGETWSSTTFGIEPSSEAWQVRFAYGEARQSVKLSQGHEVRAVRGGLCP